MRIVEGEPDHTGLGAWARALQRLLRRRQRSRRTVILSVPARRLRPSHQTEKKLQGRNTSPKVWSITVAAITSGSLPIPAVRGRLIRLLEEKHDHARAANE
jgi:hypothetical protein